jgi:hypothetical protein
MGAEKKLLFGVDDSDFSRQSLAEIGNLQKNSPNFKITIFHGASDSNFSCMARMLNLSPDELEKHRQLWSLEDKNILKKAKETLTKSGFDSKRITTFFEQGCNDCSWSMGSNNTVASDHGIRHIPASQHGG